MSEEQIDTGDDLQGTPDPAEIAARSSNYPEPSKGEDGVPKKSSVVAKLFTVVFLAAIIGISVFAIVRKQDILDWWKLRSYDPPVEIAELAKNAGFNDEGRKLFYVHEPELLDKDGFIEKCTVGEITIVLGCYLSHEAIYLFDVEDERLEGVEEVTAAHEMLHAAYDRLSSGEQHEINQLLRAAYADINDERIRSIVTTYEQRDESVVDNELHSILGTEVAALPSALETHYSRYFRDRQSVVTLALAYAEEFEKRDALIEQYQKELDSLSGLIEQLKTNTDFESRALSQERALLESFEGSPQEFNQAVVVFNQQVVAYNAQLDELRGLIDQYNDIVGRYNDIALEKRDLFDAIDTRVEEL